MATGKKVTSKAISPISRKPKASRTPKPEAAPEPAPPVTVCKHCGMGDPNRDRIAEFLALSAREKAYDLLQHPEEWLDWPNPNLGGRKPNDLIGTEDEPLLHNLLDCASLGMF